MVGDKSYATLYLPVAVQIEGATPYATAVSDNVITVTEISDGIVPANTAVLLVGTSESATATVTTSTATVSSVLSGTAETINASDVTSPYVFSCINGALGFYSFAGTVLTGGKAYYSGSSEVAAYTLEWGQADAITHVGTDTQSGKVYDLSGRQVTAPRSGLYIKNGKKFIVK